MLNIKIDTIPHKRHRYETVGDYFKKGKTTYFKISNMQNTDYEFLVLIHELCEWYLLQKKKVPISVIDKFDKQFEKDRERGVYTILQEPGHHPDAPYKNEHLFGEAVERFLADKLGVDWIKYDNTVMSL